MSSSVNGSLTETTAAGNQTNSNSSSIEKTKRLTKFDEFRQSRRQSIKHDVSAGNYATEQNNESSTQKGKEMALKLRLCLDKINKSTDQNMSSFDNSNAQKDSEIIVRPLNSARNTDRKNNALSTLIGGHRRKISSRYSQSCHEEDDEVGFDGELLGLPFQGQSYEQRSPIEEADHDDTVQMEESMQIIAEADCLDETENIGMHSQNFLTTILEQNQDSCTPNMLKQSGLHLSQLSKTDSQKRSYMMNQTTLLSFERDLHQDGPTDFAATAQFKGVSSESPADGAFCQLGSGKTFVGGNTDENERQDPIFGDQETSFFCNDKSGISMLQAMQGGAAGPIQRNQSSSEAAPLRQETLSSAQKKNQDWILNSNLLESQELVAESDAFDATAYESNGQQNQIKPFERSHQYQDTARFGGHRRQVSFSQSMENDREELYQQHLLSTDGKDVQRSMLPDQNSLSQFTELPVQRDQFVAGQADFNSSERIKIKLEASKLEETLLCEDNDDSLNRSRALQNAVKRVTDPLMLSALMKTTVQQSPKIGELCTTDSKKQLSSKQKDSINEKENQQNAIHESQQMKQLYHIAEKVVNKSQPQCSQKHVVLKPKKIFMNSETVHLSETIQSGVPKSQNVQQTRRAKKPPRRGSKQNSKQNSRQNSKKKGKDQAGMQQHQKPKTNIGQSDSVASSGQKLFANTKRRLDFEAPLDELDEYLEKSSQNGSSMARRAGTFTARAPNSSQHHLLELQPNQNLQGSITKLSRPLSTTNRHRRIKPVAQSHAASSVLNKNNLRRSQSFGDHTLMGLSLVSTHNLGLYKNMTKVELQQKLHETFCEKDKLNEKITAAIREKLESETAMIQLVHENGIIKEAYNDLREETRGFESISSGATQSKIIDQNLQKQVSEPNQIEIQEEKVVTVEVGTQAEDQPDEKEDGKEQTIQVVETCEQSAAHLQALKTKLEQDLQSERVQQAMIVIIALMAFLLNTYQKWHQ